MASIGGGAKSTFLAIVKGDASQAISEFKKLGDTTTKVTAGASGDMSKWKQLTTGAMDTVKANAGMFAATAGAAVVAFGVKAATAFADLGIQVGKFADATGLSTQAASRWIEVAGDLGIDAGALETAIGRMNKTIGTTPSVLDKFGVAIAHTSTGAVDANGTFLNVIDRLNEMENPTQRAAAGQALLGKSWQNLAELIGKGSTELKSSLEDVADVKVLSDSDVADARDYREAMDNLKDSVGELALALGKVLLPVITAVTKALAVADDVVWQYTHGADNLRAKVEEWKEAQKAATAEVDRTSSASRQAEAAVIGYTQAYEAKIQATKDAKKADQEAADQADATKRAVDDAADAYRRGADAIADQIARTEELYNLQRGAVDAQYAYEQGVYDTGEALQEYGQKTADAAAEKKKLDDQLKHHKITQEQYNKAIAEGNLTQADAENETRKVGLALVDQAAKYATLEGAALDSEDGTKRQIEALSNFAGTLDPSSPLRQFLDEYIGRLNAIPKNVTTTISAGYGAALLEFAGGTNYAPGGMALVGEQGPELVELPRGSKVHTAAKTAAMAHSSLPNMGASTNVANYITINAGVGTDPVALENAVTDALRRAARRGNSMPWAA